MQAPDSSTGANMARNRTLWEIGRHLANSGTSSTFGRSADMCILVGSGSAEHFSPSLSLANGSPALAFGVARGELDMAFVNPSALLTQAFRGTGLFAEPLPVRVVAVYPSWDRAVCVVHPRTGLTSLHEVRERKYPLRLSIRADPTHSTRVLLEQVLERYGFSLQDLQAWGGTLQLNIPPHDPRRLAALRGSEVDMVFDEGIPLWFDLALACGMQPLPFDQDVLASLRAIGWRTVVIPAGRFPHLTGDYECLDYGGWPLYTRASLDEEIVYNVCAALQACQRDIPWEAGAFTGIDQLGRDTEATPLDVPLHPGAERWYRDQGFI